MNEADAVIVLAAIGDVAGTFGAIFFSVTFAYVSVAYLVGRTLTRFQCAADQDGSIEFVLKFFIYYLHERAWQLVPRGTIRNLF